MAGDLISEAQALLATPNAHDFNGDGASDIAWRDTAGDVSMWLMNGTTPMSDGVVGTELLRRARQITAKPLVAIGGITLERAAEVYLAGADSLAVIRDLICAEKPGERAREYLKVAASTLKLKGNKGEA